MVLGQSGSNFKKKKNVFKDEEKERKENRTTTHIIH